MKVVVECADCGQRGRIALAKVSASTRCRCGSKAFDLATTSAFRIVVPGQGMTSEPYRDEEAAIREAQHVGQSAYVVYEGFDDAGRPEGGGANRVVWTPDKVAARDDQLDSADLLCPVCGGSGNYPAGTSTKCWNCGGDGKVDPSSQEGGEEWDEQKSSRLMRMAELAKADNPHLSLRTTLSLAKDALERFG